MGDRLTAVSKLTALFRRDALGDLPAQLFAMRGQAEPFHGVPAARSPAMVVGRPHGRGRRLRIGAFRRSWCARSRWRYWEAGESGEANRTTRYDRVAAVYDALAWSYSGGAIGRARAMHTAVVEPGERILYPGAGTGSDALRAAQRGARVTLVDLAPNMLARARRRFARASCHGTFVEGDVLAPAPGLEGLPAAGFDRVVASFFLNTLARAEVAPAIASLCRLLRPGGTFTIVDFCGPSQHRMLRALQQAYHLPAMLLFGVLAKNPWHGLYDLDAFVTALGLPLVPTERSVVRVLRLPLYASCSWRLS